MISNDRQPAGAIQLIEQLRIDTLRGYLLAQVAPYDKSTPSAAEIWRIHQFLLYLAAGVLGPIIVESVARRVPWMSVAFLGPTPRSGRTAHAAS